MQHIRLDLSRVLIIIFPIPSRVAELLECVDILSGRLDPTVEIYAGGATCKVVFSCLDVTRLKVSHPETFLLARKLLYCLNFFAWPY